MNSASLLSEKRIRDAVAPDEKILWVGQPRQGVFLRPADAAMIPFSLLWGGFAIFWEIGVISSGAPAFMAIWGVPFVLMGLYLIVGRFFVDARQRAATTYAVTSTQILIMSGLFSRLTKSLSIDMLTDVTLTERSNGSGTIAFGPTQYFHRHARHSMPGLGPSEVPMFDSIPAARSIYEMIREAQRLAQKQT